MEELFDADYFERGIETGKSCYTNYRWIPELTMPMVMTYIDVLSLGRTETILDFGCAKGYAVKALRMLYRKAWGCDVSRYAIKSCDTNIKEYLKLCNGYPVPFEQEFDSVIAKDVLEHINLQDLPGILSELRKCAKQMFAIVPLGNDEDRFIVPAYDLDKTHQLAKNEEWWMDRFRQSDWRVMSFRHRIEGIKDNWMHYPKGNGFFILE